MRSRIKNTPFISGNNQTKYQIIHIIAVLTLHLLPSTNQKVFWSLWHTCLLSTTSKLRCLITIWFIFPINKTGFFSLFSGSTLSIFISSTITGNQRKISTLIPSSKCKAKNYGCNYWTCTLQVVDLHELVLNLVCFMWASFHQTRFISFSLLPYP